MQQALSELLVRVESISQTIDLHDQLIAFGQAEPESVPAVGSELHRVVSEIGQSVLQPVLNGAVLLVAAAFEQFVTDTIVEFSEQLPNIVSKYEQLPERIRSNNERMTGQAIGDNRYRNRFEVYELPRFVENLRNCQIGISPYFLNGQALALHNSNLNSQTLSQLTSRLGVEGIWALLGSSEVLKEWLELDDPRDIQNSAMRSLDELIDTRNKIAHRVGVANPASNIVRRLVSFVKALAQALVAILNEYADSLSSAHSPIS